MTFLIPLFEKCLELGEVLEVFAAAGKHRFEKLVVLPFSDRHVSFELLNSSENGRN